MNTLAANVPHCCLTSTKQLLNYYWQLDLSAYWQVDSYQTGHLTVPPFARTHNTVYKINHPSEYAIVLV